MSPERLHSARRLARRIMTCIVGLRYIGCLADIKIFQRRLAFLRRMGVHAQHGKQFAMSGAF